MPPENASVPFFHVVALIMAQNLQPSTVFIPPNTASLPADENGPEYAESPFRASNDLLNDLENEGGGETAMMNADAVKAVGGAENGNKGHRPQTMLGVQKSVNGQPKIIRYEKVLSNDDDGDLKKKKLCAERCGKGCANKRHPGLCEKRCTAACH